MTAMKARVKPVRMWALQAYDGDLLLVLKRREDAVFESHGYPCDPKVIAVLVTPAKRGKSR